MELLLALTLVTALAFGGSSAAAALGCEKLDHTACDELCKADGFWYGHCSHWDGRDFQCTCYEYKKPLDPSICSDMQEQCLQECKDKGLEGGYCYPHPSAAEPRGIATCDCFEKFPAARRR
ncbi:Protein F35C5.12 [Aphelenchoides avenae]|nr:Protein F35C5.12 [Aphelenchus avenae]